ncbi:type I restriction enzyme [Streptococcus pneumoniae]|nr:type I restriction enzyme [Streptococcus pneumoniae]
MTPEQLKASILQRAMEGKLVPQNPNDEPASELLKRIKAEKEKLISEGKIKRDKKETEIFRGDDCQSKVIMSPKNGEFEGNYFDFI